MCASILPKMSISSFMGYLLEEEYLDDLERLYENVRKGIVHRKRERERNEEF